ncbi:nuclear pore complex assembly-domain-containing protein [Linnemannia elongata]|nr:nuclear pore complex assembly-domain-containing protein [Linnemannia elongata]
MSHPTEFRPVAHEFFSEGFHGAAFIGAKAADAFWFYRFDSSFIEVRDTFTCHDKVFASLSTAEIKQRFRHLLKSDKIQIVNVQDAYVGESHTIVFVVREGDEDRDHVFIWNLLTLQLQWLASPPRLLTAATVTPQQAIMKGYQGSASPTSADQDEEQEEDNGEDNQSQSKSRIQNNRRQLLVLGHRNGWMTMYKFTVSVTGQVSCNKEPEHEKWLEDGSITCLATLSNKNTGARPVIVAGTSAGKVVVIRYDDAQEGNKLESLMTIKDLHSKTLPITNLTLELTKDDGLDLLIVGQGSWLGSSKESNESPAVSMYYLRLQKSDSRLLGYLRPPTVEGEVSTGGSTLTTTVSEDANGRRVHCIFSTDFENAPSLTHLATVQINQNDVPEPDVTSMDDVGGGTLLDVSPQTNSYELMVLYLSKLVSYVKAADIESNRLESEWAEGTEASESARRDVAPHYNTFFQEKAKFTYSDSELAEIEQRRKQLGGKLFYDRLLEFVELDVGMLYPPKNHAQQRNLWTNIYFNGDLEADNRNCLAYYLLKNQHGDISEQFLREYRIPSKFVDLINGFWALDHFDFKTAVLYLSRPGLTVDWIEDVIDAIAAHGSPQLARQFLVAADLDYTSERFIDVKMKILVETDFTDAFYYQRSPAVTSHHPATEGQQVDDPTDRKERLFTALLDHCFLEKPNRKAIQVLSQLTMNETEEQMFIQYCDGHSGLTREVGQEFLIMYYVNRSRYMEAIRMHRKRLVVEREKDEAEKFHRDAINRRNSRQLGGNQNAGSSSQPTLSRSQKRQILIDQLMKVLPAPQRLILELEKEQSSHTTASAKARTALSSHLTFNTGRDVQEDRHEGDVKKRKQQKAKLACGSKGILLALLDQTDAPSTGLKGLDLDWVTRSLTGEEKKHEAEGGDLGSSDTMSVDDDDEPEIAANGAHDTDKPKVSTVEIMDLDSD